MPFGSLDAFIIGLVFIPFGKSISCQFSMGPSGDQSVPPLKGSDHVSDSHGASADDDTNVVTPLGCNHPKLMKITLSEEFKNMQEEFSSQWNAYKTVPKGEEWSRRSLTYSIHSYGNRNKDDVTDAVNRSFQKWADAAPTLKFTKMHDEAVSADIRIHFVPSLREEGGTAQAMTQYPTGGRVRFSAEINWNVPKKADSQPKTASKPQAHAYYGGGFGGWGGFGGFGGWGGGGGFKVGFVCVATHEFGHALGLAHSDTRAAIMHAYYPCEGTTDINLLDDDIKAIQYLYPGGTPKVQPPINRAPSGGGGFRPPGGGGFRPGGGGGGFRPGGGGGFRPGGGGNNRNGGSNNRNRGNDSSSDSSSSSNFSDSSESSTSSDSSSFSDSSSSPSSSSPSSSSDSPESSSSSESSESD